MLRPALLVLAAAAIVGALAAGYGPDPDPRLLAHHAAAVGVADNVGAPARRVRPAPPARADAPGGTAYVPGGRVLVGTAEGEAGMATERPAFEADVAPFLLDRAPVTVARFRAFAESTGHVTDAERFGDGGVLDREASAAAGAAAWSLAPGADWQRPLGADGPAAPDDHPVTQTSWADAAAFCAWDGHQRGLVGRLPTEVEWEHAARGARNAPGPYAWGAALDGADGRPRANTWEGRFPVENSGSDGHLRTSPVGAFGETPLGLQDVGGNVWEWTGSWLRPYPLADGVSAASDAASGPPPGPSGAPERVQRGGSYLCNPSWCHGYRVSARSSATPETALEHVGFRCAYDVPPAGAAPSPPTDG